MRFLKIIFVLLLAGYTTISISGCGEGSTQNSSEVAHTTSANGKKIYLKYCKMCHGVDGKLQLNGASDLTKSAMIRKDVIRVITNGRNTMQPYDELLSKQEIEAVADYIMKFRN